MKRSDIDNLPALLSIVNNGVELHGKLLNMYNIASQKGRDDVDFIVAKISERDIHTGKIPSGKITRALNRDFENMKSCLFSKLDINDSLESEFIDNLTYKEAGEFWPELKYNSDLILRKMNELFKKKNGIEGKFKLDTFKSYSFDYDDAFYEKEDYSWENQRLNCNTRLSREVSFMEKERRGRSSKPRIIYPKSSFRQLEAKPSDSFREFDTIPTDSFEMNPFLGADPTDPYGTGTTWGSRSKYRDSIARHGLNTVQSSSTLHGVMTRRSKRKTVDKFQQLKVQMMTDLYEKFGHLRLYKTDLIQKLYQIKNKRKFITEYNSAKDILIKVTKSIW